MADHFKEMLQKNLSKNLENSPYWKYRNLENSYDFEIVDIVWWRDFILKNRALAYYAAGVYALTIFALEKLMENRKPLNLRLSLICWNTLLGIFSLMGFIRTSQFLNNNMGTGLTGFYKRFCVPDHPEPYMVFWTVAFGLSKYVELGDTLFILLRKRPLKMIQWFHHMTTLISVWVVLPYFEPMPRYIIVTNYGVHSVMYPYFALKVAGFKIPNIVSKVITTAQFIQMISGFVLNAVTVILIAMGKNCYRSSDSICVTALTFGSFIVLFGNLFYCSVLKVLSDHKTKSKLK